MKSKYKRVLFIIISILFVLFLVNTIVSKIITSKINNLVLKDSFKLQTVSAEEVKFNIFDRSVVAKNLFLAPSRESMIELKKEELHGESLEKITVSSIEFEGISLLKILLLNTIEFDKLIIHDFLFQNFINSDDKKEKKTSKVIDLDSLKIDKIKGFEIDDIEIINFSYQEIDIQSKKLLIELKPIDFHVHGLFLEKRKDGVFKLLPPKKNIEISNIAISIPKTGYNMDVGTVTFSFNKALIDIRNVKYKPINSRDSLALSYKYNTEVYNMDLKRGIIYNFRLNKLLKKQGLLIDSIRVLGLDLQIYKDKRKPFNENKRPGIPHLILKKMKFPLLVQNIKIDSTRISYEERLDDKNEYKLMKVTLDHTNAQIYNITSIDKYREAPLEMSINSQFMNKADMHVKIKLLLKDHHDNFYFNGSLGPSRFSDFDKVIYPALGMKISKGYLDELRFSASANPEKSAGKMTMLYHGLEAKVIKQESNDRNKFLSWLVKEITYKSNPIKGKHEREIYMHTDRVVYKGFINYIWKTLQNGIIGTITPFGTTIEKERKKEERQEKRKHRSG
jgi:hypothetical protein